MHFRLILLVLVVTCLIGTAYTAAAASAGTKEILKPASSTTAVKPQGFSARSIERSDDNDDTNDGDDFESQAQTHLGYRQRPLYDYSQSEEEEQEEQPRQYYQSRNVNQQSNYLKSSKKQSSEEIESEEEEIEEPDKLSTLLAKSKFNCNSKTTGYYADETVNCEVFHYCQDNQRHSWVCPDGFTFHQIHLICMPPSNENICQQSSKYHIVNDYLYKPINLQEHQSKPNVTLRYSERYYPESYYETDRYEDEDDEPRQRYHHHQQRQPVQVGFQPQAQQQQQYQQTRQQQAVQVRHQPVQQQQQSQYQQPRHQQQQPPQQTTVYRRPVPTTTIQPQSAQIQAQVQHQAALAPAPVPQQQQQQQHYRLQTVAPALITPTPYRFFTAAPQLQQHVYRSPEEINISLQQRRPPQFIIATTPRYYEDEYLYERRK